MEYCISCDKSVSEPRKEDPILTALENYAIFSPEDADLANEALWAYMDRLERENPIRPDNEWCPDPCNTDLRDSNNRVLLEESRSHLLREGVRQWSVESFFSSYFY